MMKFAALATLLASASAFAPAQTSRSVTALNADKSQALPFMNKPDLVRTVVLRWRALWLSISLRCFLCSLMDLWLAMLASTRLV